MEPKVLTSQDLLKTYKHCLYCGSAIVDHDKAPREASGVARYCSVECKRKGNIRRKRLWDFDQDEVLELLDDMEGYVQLNPTEVSWKAICAKFRITPSFIKDLVDRYESSEWVGLDIRRSYEVIYNTLAGRIETLAFNKKGNAAFGKSMMMADYNWKDKKVEDKVAGILTDLIKRAKEGKAQSDQGARVELPPAKKVLVRVEEWELEY